MIPHTKIPSFGVTSLPPKLGTNEDTWLRGKTHFLVICPPDLRSSLKDASEGEAPGTVKEEAKAVKEVRPPAHNCRSLLTQAHCSLPTYACSASCSSHHAQLTVHAVLSCVPFFLSLLPPTACRTRRRQEPRRPQWKKDDVEAEAKEEVPREGRRQEGRSKKAEGKKVAATVVPQPLDGEGNPVDTEKCTVTIIEEDPTKKRKRTKR